MRLRREVGSIRIRMGGVDHLIEDQRRVDLRLFLCLCSVIYHIFLSHHSLVHIYSEQGCCEWRNFPVVSS